MHDEFTYSYSNVYLHTNIHIYIYIYRVPYNDLELAVKHSLKIPDDLKNASIEEQDLYKVKNFVYFIIRKYIYMYINIYP
jgi:hypothetical protein